MIYFDSSAIVELIRKEIFTSNLMSWLQTRSTKEWVRSTLAEIEVPRALLRNAPTALVALPTVVAKFYRIEINAVIRTTATSYSDPTLKSLDIIHLATAQFLSEIGSLEFFVAYDNRLIEAAQALRLPVASPGIID